jgi:hypothetical protein
MHQSLLTYTETVIHPIALTVTLIAGLLILFLPRRFAIVPLLVSAIFITLQQQIIIATLNFTMLRILVLFGWLRLLMRSEYEGFRLSAIDVVMILWVIARTVSYVLLWQTPEALIYRLGGAFDALGIFFLMRLLIRDFGDVEYVFKVLAIICVPLAIAMLVERATGSNLFAVFGGVPEMTLIRDGRLRCQGAFKHPILAGVFGASLLPLFLSLFCQDERRKGLAVVGAISATVIVLSTASSGPAIACLAGLAGMGLWLFRKIVSVILWAAACGLIALQIFMKAPIWALLWRIKIFGASTGYHRYLLFDQFINRFNEWWLIGTQSYTDWGRRLFDVTNQYVRTGVDGGIITLLLFIAIIMFGFNGVRKALRAVEDQRGTEILVWALGASLFCHAVAYFGVSYFDQIIVIWYMLLAMIAAAGGFKEPASQDSGALNEEFALQDISHQQLALKQS